MPIYEYKCAKCGEEFEVVLSVEEHTEKDKNHQIQCPKCQSTEVHHEVESVFVTTSRKS